MRSTWLWFGLALVMANSTVGSALAQGEPAPLRGSVAGQPAEPEPEAGVKKDDDEGRPPTKTFLWLEAGGGLGIANMQKFDFVSQSLFTQQKKGGVFNVGAGLRLFLFTIGARLAYAPYDGFSLGAGLLELGIRIPAGIVEPFFRAFGGYGWVGRPNLSDAKGSEINGAVFGGGIGVSVFLFTNFSITASFDMDALALGVSGLKDALDPSTIELEAGQSLSDEEIAEIVAEREAQADKAHLGLQQRIQLTLGFHL